MNTDTDLTDGTWFFESVGDKIIKQIAITRPVGTAPNPDVEVQVLVDGVYVTLDQTEQIRSCNYFIGPISFL